MAKTSPTQRSLKSLRSEGYECGIVEKFNSFVKIRQDLFGFIDIVAIHPGNGIIGVQTTVYGSLKARIDKIKAESRSALWLAAGGRIMVHGWRKWGMRGKVKRWHCKVLEISIHGVHPFRKSL